MRRPRDVSGPVPPQDRPGAESPPSASRYPDSRREASGPASPPRLLSDGAGQDGGPGGPGVPCQSAAVIELHRFGLPSDYGLTAAELPAHVRQLRRSGWQSWEIRVRFDYREAA
jgi:hypothetical protein